MVRNSDLWKLWFGHFGPETPEGHFDSLESLEATLRDIIDGGEDWGLREHETLEAIASALWDYQQSEPRAGYSSKPDMPV